MLRSEDFKFFCLAACLLLQDLLFTLRQDQHRFERFESTWQLPAIGFLALAKVFAAILRSLDRPATM